GNFDVGVYVSVDSTIDPSDTRIYTIHFGSLQPLTFNGQEFQIPLPGSRPAGAAPPAGGYTIGMIVDVNNVVPESNEGNNSNLGNGFDKRPVTIRPPQSYVSDSVGSSTDLAMDFGTIINDGSGNSSVTHVVTLTNPAVGSKLKVPQNGIRLADGSNFRIVKVLSNQLSQVVNVAGGASLIDSDRNETWTIEVAFDPKANGSLNDTLIIESDDPVFPVVNVALSGVGKPVSNLRVGVPSGSPDDVTVNFGDLSVDNAPGSKATRTITLSNNGSGPLSIEQNGILLGAGPFAIQSITSSTQGAINLATGAMTIAASNAEAWNVVVEFDPTANGLYQVPLTIQSDDPDQPSYTVTLVGAGKTAPTLSLSSTSLAFGNIHADGAGKQSAQRTLELKNLGELPLSISQSGLNFATGAHYRIVSVVSSTKGEIDIETSPASIAPGANETWTITLEFDPSAAGSLPDTFRITSNDPANSIASVALSGTGLDQPELRVEDGDTVPFDNSFTLPAVLNDGTGGRSVLKTLKLTNIGNQPLTVGQDGLVLVDGVHYRLFAITSSPAGTIDLSTGPKTIAPRGAETWNVLFYFDPTTTGDASDILRIQSDDPQSPVTDIALVGEGSVPNVTLQSIEQDIHISAGAVLHLDFTGQYAPGTGKYNVFIDYDRNPTNGKAAIIGGLSQDTTSFDWRVSEAFSGDTLSIYAEMADGPVTNGVYSIGTITVDPIGTDRLTSAPVTDQENYALTALVNNQVVQSEHTLGLGVNILRQTDGNGDTREYRVTRVPTLVDADHTNYDELGNVVATIDSAGRETEYTYDFLSRLTRITYPTGE
ncbi:MAG: choice-of-anchor D domain-containing protein, partial [Planctomycetaceae bacterium]|nr:choice-of-anchor D domain-containing protein [Planctomycetaceae bacterium]